MEIIISRLRQPAVLALALTLVTACNSAALTQGPRLASSQALRVLLDDQPQTLDPGQTQYSFETSVLRVISEPLLKPTPDLRGVVPAAAESFEVNDAGTVYTFNLRKNAAYWDGQMVKAQDFVYAWRRLIDPRLAAPTATFFSSAVYNGDRVSVLDPQRDASIIDQALTSLGLTAVDDSTFQVRLSRPDPAFVWLAAMPSGAPIRQDVVAKYADKWSTSPESLVTNGAFQVTEMIPNDHLTLVPNPHYWGPKPKLTSITFVVINDGAAALARYQHGDLDVMGVQPAQAAAIAGDRAQGKNLVKTPALTVYWIAFRVTSPLLSDARVRDALAESIDRKQYVRQILEGLGQPAETFIPQGMRSYAPDVGASQSFDIAAARAALASAGVSPSRLDALRFSYDKSSDFSRATAQFVHDQLQANLGVGLALDPLDTNTLDTRLASGTFDIAGPLGWTADYPDPADWFPIFTTTNSYNYSLYQNSKYDGLVAAAATDTRSARRDLEYQQAQRILVNDAPAAFLAQTVSWYLVQPYVRGLETTPVDEWPGEIYPASIYLLEH